MRSSLSPTRRGFLASAASAGVLAVLSCTAQTTQASRVDALVDSIIKEKRAPGIVIARGERGAPAQYLTRGNLAFGAKAPVDQNSLWRIYSMTKPMTGMAAMILMSEHKLKLDQPVADFIPAFAKVTVSNDGAGLASQPARTPLTVRHLLTHTSGLIYGEFTASPISDAYKKLGIHPLRTTRADKSPIAPSLAEFAERLATIPLVSEPGRKWVYGVGLDLLGRVIEVASGEPFDQYLQRRLIDPLGMTSTFFTAPAALKDRFATSYERKTLFLDVLDPATESIYLDRPQFPYGGAGLVSSAHDYDRFLAMIGNGGMLDGEEIIRADALDLGVSNLAPEDADLSELRSTTGNPSEAQGAGGAITLDGAAAGTFGWAGMAGTVGRVNVKTGRRYGGYLNVVGEIALMNDLGPAILQDLT